MQQQIEEISELAGDLWRGFLQDSSKGLVMHSHLSLLDPTQLQNNQGISYPLTPANSHPTAVAFLYYCESKLLPSSRRNGIVPVVLNVLKPGIRSVTSFANDPANGKSCWAQNGVGIEIQIVHHSHLGNTHQTGRRLFAKILLHEIGHYVRHCKDLLAHSRNAPPIATAEQEEEAWFFSGVVWALAKAQKANEDRTRSMIGEVWELD